MTLDTALRCFGLVMQLTGISLAAIGIVELRQRYSSRPGVVATVRQTSIRLWRHLVRRHRDQTVDLTGIASMGLSGRASLTTTFAPADPKTAPHFDLDQGTNQMDSALCHAEELVLVGRGLLQDRHPSEQPVRGAKRQHLSRLRLSSWSDPPGWTKTGTLDTQHLMDVGEGGRLHVHRLAMGKVSPHREPDAAPRRVTHWRR